MKNDFQINNQVMKTRLQTADHKLNLQNKYMINNEKKLYNTFQNNMQSHLSMENLKFYVNLSTKKSMQLSFSP